MLLSETGCHFLLERPQYIVTLNCLFGSFLVVRRACPASSSLLAQRHTWVLESGGLHFNPVSAKR